MTRIHSKIVINIETGVVESDDFYWYNGPLAEMKASQQQKDAATQSQDFTNQLRSQFSTQFANTANIQNGLISNLNGIMSQAENGQGYTPATLAALNTNNTEANTTQTNNAISALNRQVTQQSNGGTVPTGASNQLRAQILASGAASTATGQRNIILGNQQQANSNLFNASGQIASLTGQQTSANGSLLSAAVNNGANSYNEVTQAYQPSNIFGNILTGAATAAGTALAGPLGGAVAKSITGSSTQTPTSSSYESTNMGPIAGYDPENA